MKVQTAASLVYQRRLTAGGQRGWCGARPDIEGKVCAGQRRIYESIHPPFDGDGGRFRAGLVRRGGRVGADAEFRDAGTARADTGKPGHGANRDAERDSERRAAGCAAAGSAVTTYDSDGAGAGGAEHVTGREEGNAGRSGEG